MKQVRAVLTFLNDCVTSKNKFELFVLDNVSNNGTVLLELKMAIKFNPQKKTLLMC